MSKYFKETQEQKIKLSDYFKEVELKYSEDERGKSLEYVRIKHIYDSLGDVAISKEMIDTICKTFSSGKCRYGTVCLKKESVQALYEISKMFPELSEEALIMISREYIDDLFKEYSLLEVLSMMLRKDGVVDSTFESFMEYIKEKALILETKYKQDAEKFKYYFRHYSYDFVMYFEKFMREHHITFEKIAESTPDYELFLKDQLQLREMSKKYRECWAIGTPVSYEMLEQYLDGDTELSKYPEEISYYLSISKETIPASFTKTQFLEDIEKQKSRRK